MSKTSSQAIAARNDVRELTATESNAISGGYGYHTITTPGGSHYAIWYDKLGRRHVESLGNW